MKLSDAALLAIGAVAIWCLVRKPPRDGMADGMLEAFRRRQNSEREVEAEMSRVLGDRRQA